jgi:hypothetical protein
VTAWSPRPARLGVALAAGAAAAALLAVALTVQADPDAAARREIGSQLPFGADVTRWWWIGAVAVILLGAAGLAAGGARRPGPAVFGAMGAMDLAIALGAVALHGGERGPNAPTLPWWLLALAAVAAVGVALAPRPDRRPPGERVTSGW